MIDSAIRRPDWDTYFSGLVSTVATRATCDRGRSGCVIVRENQLITTGYVGSPPGFPHCDAIGHEWSKDGKHCIRTLHAEQNAIIQASRLGVPLQYATVYCTMVPCATCAMMLVSLRIDRVVAQHPYPSDKEHRGAAILGYSGVGLDILSTEELYVP